MAGFEAVVAGEELDVEDAEAIEFGEDIGLTAPLSEMRVAGEEVRAGLQDEFRNWVAVA